MWEEKSASTNKHTIMCEKTVIFVGNAVEASHIKSDRLVLFSLWFIAKNNALLVLCNVWQRQCHHPFGGRCSHPLTLLCNIYYGLLHSGTAAMV
jgi:hypothetical protein